MRTAINVVLILVAALAVGYYLRSRGPQLAENSISVPQYADTEPSADSSTSLELPDDEPVPEGWLTEFTLTERSGREVTSQSLLGQPYVVSFFFSTCPSVCVMQNQKVQQLQNEFTGQPVRFVAISVDPTVDTPERLSEYAERYKADKDQWLFLTGDLLLIRRIGGEMFRVAVSEKFHTEKFILVDAKGKVAGYYSWTEERQFEKLKADIKKMLSEIQGQS